MCADLQVLFWSNLDALLFAFSKSSVPRSPLRRIQIDASQQQRQFRRAERDLGFAGRRSRPAEPPLLQPLGANPQAAPVPEEQLQAVALRISENEDMTA